MKPIELLQKHCEFKTPYDCYILLAVSRKKDTPEITNSLEIVFREVIKREEDIIRKYNKIKAQVVNYEDENGKKFPFYLYVSCNARDSKKATFTLMNQMMIWIEEETRGIDRSRMFKKIYGHFYSALMKKESRAQGQRYFLIDVDTKDEKIIQKINDILNKYHFQISEPITSETRNGFHYKTEPFNREKFMNEIIKNKLNDVCEVKTDANFFIEYIN